MFLLLIIAKRAAPPPAPPSKMVGTVKEGSAQMAVGTRLEAF